MLNRCFLTFFLFFLITFNIHSQSNFYNVDTVRTIKLYFYEEQWDEILDSFYILGNNDRILADLVIDGISYDSVGVRYKGYSSASVDRIKNPFNIKLDHSIEDQNHLGYKKIKLANSYQDPSFIREVLSYEITSNYMPAPKANYANLFINDTLWGLYTNVESVNNNFLIQHYKSKYNPFFKCNPENINIQISGENSNLSNSHGTDSLNYQPYYALKSEFGWSDLYFLIDSLNNYPDSINNLLNVNRILWMHAINYCLINFDSYVGYAQNYYLYRSRSRQFNPIMWDFNMSFGGFRITDASQLYFNGFDILQAQEMDPLIHYNFISVSPRPLMRKLFLSERNRRMYIAHIRTIMQENFVNQNYHSRASYLQSVIDQYVMADTNKFYTYSDFIANIDSQLVVNSSLCPGITQLMDARSNYLSSYNGYNGAPSITNLTQQQSPISLGGDLYINAQVDGANKVFVFFRYGDNEIFKEKELFDDGNHNDGLAADGIYGSKISNVSNSIEYYFYAENDSSGIFSPVRADYEYYTLSFDINYGDLVINELMSNNKNIVSDNSGSFEDWIELYNTTNYPISTNNLYLTDTISNLFKWKLPNQVVSPNSYLIVWVDNDSHQGVEHANFKLSNLGETVVLSSSSGSIIDSVTYPTQNQDVSYARSPNGVGGFNMLTPTFNSNNDFINSLTQNQPYLLAYPNPFSNHLSFNRRYDVKVMNSLGQIIYEKDNVSKISTSKFLPGIYFVSLDNITLKLIKIK